MITTRGVRSARVLAAQILLRLTTGQKIVTLPDIVTEQFDDIVGGLGTDLDSYIPEQCQECPLLAGMIEALKMALAQKEALERTASG